MSFRLRLWLPALGLALFVHPAAAAPPQAVIELFTSQGCSSCPPADALAADLARRPELIVLTFPVDYWDYLGWKDTLADPLFSARQRAYAYGRGDRQVYTPQVIVNGTKPCIGSNRAQIEQWAGTEPKKPPLPVNVTATERDGRVVVDIEASPERVATAEVWLLPILRSEVVSISRGENRGRTITYTNVVRGMMRIGEWRGGAARFESLVRGVRAEADGYVVLLQAFEGPRPGIILGAGKSTGL
jgi:hypothetical protein